MPRIVPNNFYAQPNLWAGGQMGHAGITLIASYWQSQIWQYFTGSAPYWWAVLVIPTIVYIFAIELPQRGKFWDSLEDIIWSIIVPAFFIYYGVAHESVGLTTVLLTVGYALRYWQAYKEGRDI